MATGDIRPYNTGGLSDVPVWTWQTEAGGTAINAGEPVKLDSAGSPYVIPFADGDLTIGTDTAMIGVTANASDHTASADGSVDVYMPMPGTVWAMKATTPANVDTQAEIDALRGDRVVMNLAAGVYTLDENAGDAATSAFYILNGDPATGELFFNIRVDATYLGA